MEQNVNDLEVEVGQNVVYSAAKIELMPDKCHIRARST